MRSGNYKYANMVVTVETRKLCRQLAKMRSAKEGRFVTMDNAVRAAVELEIAAREKLVPESEITAAMEAK